MQTNLRQDALIAEWLTETLDLRLDYTDLIESIIADNFEPSDIFPNKVLHTWAKNYCEPDDIFSTGVLSEWARNNGFTKDE